MTSQGLPAGANFRNDDQGVSVVSKVLLIVIFVLAIAAPGICAGSQICTLVNGASVIAQDGKNTFLGKVTSKYSSDSIFNAYGLYGSEYQMNSVWNKYGLYGSEYQMYSATNSYTATPPLLVKQGRVIGYLSANRYLSGTISPALLKALCEDVL